MNLQQFHVLIFMQAFAFKYEGGAYKSDVMIRTAVRKKVLLHGPAHTLTSGRLSARKLMRSSRSSLIVSGLLKAAAKERNISPAASHAHGWRAN